MGAPNTATVPSVRLATIDVGTNSVKLLITEQAPDGSLTPLWEDRCVTRLGEGLDLSGTVSGSALERLIQTLQEFRTVADLWHVEHCVVVGTSASRDSGNTLISVVQERTGLPYEILSGEQEAEIGFEGALQGLPHIHGRIISCDIGGGSTEFVDGEADGRIYTRTSLDIGSVRITERCFSMLPPCASEIHAAKIQIRQALADLPFSDRSQSLLVGASDTQRLLLDLHHGLITEKISLKPSGLRSIQNSLKEQETHAKQLSQVQVELWAECLIQMHTPDILELDAEKLHERADVFPAAVLILLEIMNYLGKTYITVSPWGLCQGVALRHFHTQATVSRT